MKIKKILSLFLLCSLLVLITGCGLTSKDTVNETKPLSTTQIYALTDKGISISDSNGNKWDRAIQKGKANRIVSSVFLDSLLVNNTLFIATDRGLAVSTANQTAFDNYLEDQQINSICLNGSNILVATEQGCYLATANYNFVLISKASPYNKIIADGENLFASAKNKLYVCTANIYSWSEKYVFPETILDFDVTQGNVYTLTDKTLYINGSRIENLMSEKMNALYVDKTKNTVWVSTDKGLNKSSDKGKSWVVFDKSSGLETLEINSILIDNLNIYLGTPYGLIHSVNAGETWKMYKKTNGLVSSKILKVFIRK